jgi:hypothetical protein
MSTTPPFTTEEALEYLQCHMPPLTIKPGGFKTWKPIIVGMIDRLNLDQINLWIEKHHQKLGYTRPGKTTVRGWLVQIRKDEGKSLRKRTPKSERMPTGGAKPSSVAESKKTASAAAAPPRSQHPSTTPKPCVQEPTIPKYHKKPALPPPDPDKPMKPDERFLAKVESLMEELAPRFKNYGDIASVIEELPVDENFPETFIALKNLTYRLMEEREPERDGMRSHFRSIRRLMADNNLDWVAPF